jgi:SAM-dependent methyltransferase
MPSVNTFVWARDCGTKQLIRRVGAPYTQGLSVRRVLDVGSGTSEEIAELWPDAAEYTFLDSFTWPPERPRYRLLRQSAGEPLPFPDDSLDLVTSNGSFDHFTDAERRTSFREIERCLRPGGLFLFACEYFDFDPTDEQAFFRRCATHPETVAMNCPAFSNINLRALCEELSTLRPLQDDRSRLPDGQPLRALAGPEEARYFRSHSPTLEIYWGSFFVAFEKQGLT